MIDGKPKSKEEQEAIEHMEAHCLCIEGRIELAYIRLLRRVRELEAENADLKNQLKEAMEKY